MFLIIQEQQLKFKISLFFKAILKLLYLYLQLIPVCAQTITQNNRNVITKSQKQSDITPTTVCVKPNFYRLISHFIR